MFIWLERPKCQRSMMLPTSATIYFASVDPGNAESMRG